MKKIFTILYISARVMAAVIMLQTLYFKFSGAAESIYIFSAVGIEPWGRFGLGMAEGLASVLLLIPRTAWIGGLLGLGLMTGAIFSHLFILGIEVQNDGGLLFAYACIVFVCCAWVLWHNRLHIQQYLQKKIAH